MAFSSTYHSPGTSVGPLQEKVTDKHRAGVPAPFAGEAFAGAGYLKPAVGCVGCGGGSVAVTTRTIGVGVGGTAVAVGGGGVAVTTTTRSVAVVCGMEVGAAVGGTADGCNAVGCAADFSGVAVTMIVTGVDAVVRLDRSHANNKKANASQGPNRRSSLKDLFFIFLLPKSELVELGSRS